MEGERRQAKRDKRVFWLYTLNDDLGLTIIRLILKTEVDAFFGKEPFRQY